MGYMEILSLLGGALSGFIFKMMAQNSKDKADQFNRLIEAIKASDSSADAASKRVPNDKAGNWVRRFLVVSMVFGIIVAPFIFTVLHEPTIVQVVTPEKTIMGLFSWGGKTQFYALNGYLLSPELRSATLAVFGYYFGISAAKR